MKQITAIWITGVLLSFLLIGYTVFIVNYFEGRLIIPVIWAIINLVPISLLVGIYMYQNKFIQSKWLTILVLIFLLLCIGSLLSKRSMGSHEAYLEVIQYVPFFLLPLQMIIIFYALRLGNLKNQLVSFFQTENREKLIQLIQNGKTDKALELMLKETNSKNSEIFKYLSLQKNNYVEANRKHLASLIDDQTYLQIKNKVNQSLLEFL